MSPADITVEDHYSIRLGLWRLVGRVDAVDGDAVIAWVYDLQSYRRVLASDVIYPTRSPEEQAAMKSRRLEEIVSFVRSELDDIRTKQELAPTHGWPEQRGRVIHKQGTVFTEGDYGR
jgi:hypothetical protein